MKRINVILLLAILVLPTLAYARLGYMTITPDKVSDEHFEFSVQAQGKEHVTFWIRVTAKGKTLKLADFSAHLIVGTPEDPIVNCALAPKIEDESIVYQLILKRSIVSQARFGAGVPDKRPGPPARGMSYTINLKEFMKDGSEQPPERDK